MQQGFLLGAVKPLPYFYIVTATLGVLFTFISPDSHRSFLEDLAFWLSQTLFPLSTILMMHLLLAKFARFQRLGNLWKLIFSGICGITIYLPLALWLDVQFDMQTIADRNVDLAWEFIEEFTAVGPPILIGWLAMNAPWLLGYRFERQTNPNTLEIKVAQSPEIAEQDDQSNAASELQSYPSFFPEDLQSIVCLKAELHYLQVITGDGQSLELLNLRDAVNLLSSVDGLCPHRSWWVNRRFIERYVAAGRQGKLVVKGNLEVPVSRRKMAEVKSQLREWGIMR